jgi:hypothetical protein
MTALFTPYCFGGQDMKAHIGHRYKMGSHAIAQAITSTDGNQITLTTCDWRGDGGIKITLV